MSLTGLVGLASVALTLLPGGYLQDAAAQSLTYVRKFPGEPSSPQPFNAPDIDVTVLGHDSYTIQPMLAQHGPDCGPPPATHPIVRIEDTVFQCKNHIMTAMFNGYGAIYLTPNQLMDFSQGEAVLRWNMSTARTSSRDWVDVVIQPFDQNLQINFEDAHIPQEAVHLEMIGGGTVFEPTIFRNYVKERVAADMFNGYDHFLTPSATRRDTFELRLSKNHMKFGMPEYNQWWIDTEIQPLSWNLGVVQLNQRTYNAEKACNFDGSCGPNTWHWDNIQIQPAVPFALLRADRRVVDAAHPEALNFGAPAPAGSHLHFVGVGVPVEFSLDGGASWQPAAVQGRPLNRPEHGEAYWQPVPEGTQSVLLRGQNNGTIAWALQDISIWGPPGSQSAGGFVPVPEGAISSAPAAAAALTAPAEAAPVAVAAQAPTPVGAIAFDDLPDPNRAFNGEYPAGVIDWGSNQWYLSGPFGAFRTQSFGFNGPSLRSASFALLTPRTVVSIDAFNGEEPSTVTLSCAGQPDVQLQLAHNQLTTIVTGWTAPCQQVTIASTNGWGTNFKNLVLSD